MALSPIEAYDLIRFSDLLQDRLAAAEGELSPKRGLKAEKEWLAAASVLLKAAREPVAGLLEKVRGLPELVEVRDEYAAEFQGHWVDALERLLAGITFHAGNRDPIIEALYPHQKFPALRRADKDGVLEYAKELERRMKSSYVSRMLTSPNYAFATPVLEALAAAYAKWQSAFVGEGMSEDQASELRKELVSNAKKLDVAVKQARLLSEAALAPVPGMFEEMGLAAKPKKRTKPNPKPAKKEDGSEAEGEEAAPAEAVEEQAEPAEAAEPAPEKPAPEKAEAKKADKSEKPAAEAAKPKKRKAAQSEA